MDAKAFCKNYGVTKNSDGSFYYGGWLGLEGTQITALPDNLTVGGGLNLEGTQITALPDNLTVGGWLNLRGTQITALPDNLTVGGWLNLEGTQITALPDNLTVGGGGEDIYSCAISREEKNKIQPAVVIFQTMFTWQNGKYIMADDIFSEVVSNRKNIYRIKNISRAEVEYLVTDGDGKWAHGKTLKEAKADLVYKISDRDTSKYKDLTLDSVLNHEKAIEMYRTITGACASGTRGFVETLTKVKKEYTIREIIDLTKGCFGNQVVKQFFGLSIK